MNVLTDLAAKKCLQEQIINGQEVESSAYHGEGWTCWLGDEKCEDFTHHELKQWI